MWQLYLLPCYSTTLGQRPPPVCTKRHPLAGLLVHCAHHAARQVCSV